MPHVLSKYCKETSNVFHSTLALGSGDWPEVSGSIWLGCLWEIKCDASWDMCNMDDCSAQAGYYPVIQVVTGRGNAESMAERVEFIVGWIQEHFPNWNILEVRQCE